MSVKPKGILETSLLTIAFIGIIGAVARASIPTESPYQPAPMKTGTELVMVLLATSTCAGIADPGMEPAIHEVREALRVRAAATGSTLVTVGISLDWSLKAGLELLDRFGPFDEISVGRGWINSSAYPYIWGDMRGSAAVPQIIVYERDVIKAEELQITAERQVTRRIGAPNILSWGAALAGGTE